MPLLHPALYVLLGMILSALFYSYWQRRQRQRASSLIKKPAGPAIAGSSHEHYYRQLLENVNDITAVITRNGTIRFISPAVTRLLRYPTGDLINSNAFDLIHPDDLDAALAEVSLLTRVPESARHVEVRLRHQNGSWWSFEIKGANLLSDPVIQGVVLTARSLLHRRQEEWERKVVLALAEAMRETPDRDSMVSVLLNQLLLQLAAEGAAVAVRDPINDEVLIELGCGAWQAWTGERLAPGAGVSGYVMTQRETCLIENALQDPLFARPELLGGLRAVAAVPMITREQCIGALMIGRRELISSSDLQLLTAISDLAASTLHRATLYDQTQRRAERLTIINHLGRILSESPDLRQIYRAISTTVHQLMPDISSLVLADYDVERQLITAVYVIHDGAEVDVSRFPPAPLAPPGEGIQSEVIRSGRPLIVNDVRQRLRSGQTKVIVPEPGPAVQSALYAPMITSTRVGGVMQVQSYTLNRFSQMDLELLSLVANSAAIAIQNTSLLADLKQSNAELIQAAAELRHLIDNANAPIFGIDAQGKINEWNKAAERVTGFRKRDVLDQDLVQELILPANRASIKTVLENALQGQETANYELTLTKQTGEKVLVLLNATARRNVNGQITGVLGVGQDITERKQAEEALQYSEATNRALLDAFPDLLFRLSREGIVLDVRTGGEQMTLPREQLMGLNLKEIVALVGDHMKDLGERVLPAFERVLATAQAEVIECRWEQPGQEIRHYEIRLIAGSEAELLAIVRHITEEKHAEEAIRQTQKLESIGLLAGGVAHDFNNLLMGMLGQTSLAMAKLPAAHAARPHVEKAVLSAQRAADLTRQLLAYAGKGKFQVEPLDLNQLIGDNERLLETVLSRRARLVINLTPNLPPIQADRGQVQQVVMNLVINAAEAIQTELGDVTIETGCQQIDGDGALAVIGDEELVDGLYVCLTISDTGSGMEQATLDRIFDPFFSTKESGRGLGLSATLGIMRAHAGGLQVKSRPGQGSSFRVYFPAGSSGPERQVKQAGGASEPIAGVVLVIDDEEPVREAIIDILDTVSIKVLAATNGQEGVELFQRHRAKIDLVLLDMQMPVMSGEETFQTLRRIDPAVKVILSSGYSEAEATRALVGQGIGAFLQKPYDINILIDEVRRALQSE